MKYFASVGGERLELDLVESGGIAEVAIGERTYAVDLRRIDGREMFSLLVDHASYDVIIERTNGGFTVTVGGESFRVDVLDEREAMSEQVLAEGGEGGGEDLLRSVIPGIVASVLVEEGQSVEAGQAVLTIEAMKMENEVRANMDGVVEAVYVEKGQTVPAGGDLVLIRPLEGPPIDSIPAIDPEGEPETNF